MRFIKTIFSKIAVFSRISSGITLLLAVGLPLVANAITAEKYQNAKIAVNYQGSVGQLAQDMAYRLGVAYYSNQANPNVQVKVVQNSSRTIQNLLDSVNSQLQDSTLQFIQLDNQTTLALMQKAGDSNYIGPITFDDDNTTPATDTDTNKSETVTTNQNNQQEQLMAEKKMKEIIALSQDQKLLEQYTKRKQPIYRINNAKAVHLAQVRTTKVSTFLIFDNNVDVNKYKIEGKFQEIVKLNNIVAILHRQQPPTDKITIIAPNGAQQVLTKVQ